MMSPEKSKHANDRATAQRNGRMAAIRAAGGGPKRTTGKGEGSEHRATQRRLYNARLRARRKGKFSRLWIINEAVAALNSGDTAAAAALEEQAKAM